MRIAKSQDVWRKAIGNRVGAYTINSLTLKNVRGIGDKDVTFPTMITALCGENGVGKTTLLKTLFSTIAPIKAASLGIRLKPQDARFSATAICEITTRTTVKTETGKETLVETFSDQEKISKFFKDDGEEPLAIYIDAAATAQRLIHLISTDADFASVLEGVPQSVDPDEMRKLRQEITGRTYSKVITSEIEDYNNLPIFPYFIVTAGNVTYGSEEMGLGELCVNYMLWALARCKSGGLLLLEEPESHLPPRAQERLITHVAALSVENNFNIVLSTHSQHTLANIPTSHITFLGRLGDKCIIQRNPNIVTLYESLRITTSSLSLLILEDHSAFAFLKRIIEEYEPALLGRFDFIWKNGWGDIDEILTRIPRHINCKVSILGIYDGDQRNAPRPAALDWPHLYLPGSKDPAEYMVEVTKDNAAEFAALLRYDPTAMELAIANIGETDVKDFFSQLRKATGEDLQGLYQAATELWLCAPQNQIPAKLLMQELKRAAFS